MTGHSVQDYRAVLLKSSLVHVMLALAVNLKLKKHKNVFQVTSSEGYCTS